MITRSSARRYITLGTGIASAHGHTAGCACVGVAEDCVKTINRSKPAGPFLPIQRRRSGPEHQCVEDNNGVQVTILPSGPVIDALQQVFVETDARKSQGLPLHSALFWGSVAARLPLEIIKSRR